MLFRSKLDKFICKPIVKAHSLVKTRTKYGRPDANEGLVDCQHKGPLEGLFEFELKENFVKIFCSV